MDLLAQSSLIVAITSFALGGSVLARNPRNKLFIAFSALAFAISCWELTFFLDQLWRERGFYRWHLFFNLWLAPLGLTLIRVFLRFDDKFSRRLFDVSLALGAGFTVALLFGYDRVPWVLQAMYYLPGLVVFQILQLMVIDRWIRQGRQRVPKAPSVGFGRRSLIYLGGLLVLMTAVLDHVPSLGAEVPVLGNLALTAYVFFMSRAVTHQRLLNFGALFSRFLVLLALALVLTGIYSLLFAAIEGRPALFLLNSFIISFLLVTVLEPLRTFVTYLTQRMLTQRHRRLQEIVRDGQRGLALVMDPGTLFQTILNLAEQTLQPRWGALFVLRSDGIRLRRTRVFGEERTNQSDADGSLREILVTHPLLEQCDRLRKRGELPILLDQILENERDRSASRVQREQIGSLVELLHAFGANLMIPLYDEGKLLGVVLLGLDGPPEPWGGNWGLLSVLYPYFEAAAKTLRGMEIYARSRERERLATLGQMSAGLAHEIRNPLGAIKGAAQYLTGSSFAAAVGPDGKFLQVIVEEVDRLNRVVTQFLDYSKPAALELKPVDLSALAEKTADFVRTGIPEGIHIECVPARQPAIVAADSGPLHQVVMNLVQNSVKALEGRSGGHIRISVETAGYPAGEVGLVVEDNGAGIKRENVDRIFIPFFTTSPSGTGLGLSISQKIIEAHRGRIDVVSEEGRFTRFSVILPLANGKEG